MPWSTVIHLVEVTRQAVPWAIPLVAVGGAIAITLGVALQRGRGARAWLASGLIVSVALIVGITLTPHAAGTELALPDPRPDQAPWRYAAAPEFWLHLDSRSLNVALFIPLGITLGLLVRGRARWLTLAAGLCVPWLIEGLQAILPFDRDPQAIDLVDNSTGFVVGYLVGLTSIALMSAASAARTRAASA